MECTVCKFLGFFYQFKFSDWCLMDKAYMLAFLSFSFFCSCFHLGFSSIQSRVIYDSSEYMLFLSRKVFGAEENSV